MNAELMLLRKVEELERQVDALRRELARVPVRVPVGGGGGEFIRVVDLESQLSDLWETWKTATLAFALNTQRLWVRVDDGYICLSQVGAVDMFLEDP